MTQPTPDSCCSGSSCCGPTPQPLSLSRRTFIAATTAAAGTLLSRSGLFGIPIAGPFAVPDDPNDFPIPADKKLTPEWLASLTARGTPTVYKFNRGPLASATPTLDELNFIGMPVGGVCTGQLYLGGDGKLWLWDIFNQPAAPGWNDSGGGMYAKPPPQSSPIEQGFAIKVGAAPPRRLDRTGFSDIEFKGSYPTAEVRYRDKSEPVEVTLEAFSPFIPLDENESGIPATILNYTVKNTGATALDVQLAGWLQNPVCYASMKNKDLRFRKNEVEQNERFSVLKCSATPLPPKEPIKDKRPDILFDDFEKPTYAESMGGWTATGRAFGQGPVEVAKRPGYMGELNAKGLRTVNTHVTEHGEDVGKADTYIGTLTSREFTIDRHYISFLIGGGKHPGQECINLLIDGAPVRTATGANANKMRLEHFDVREFADRKARLQIVDAVSGGWGQIGIDDIVFCDEPREAPFVMEEQGDYGTMCLACMGPPNGRSASPVVVVDRLPASAFSGYRPDYDPGIDPKIDQERRFVAQPIGCIAQQIQLAPGESKAISFIIAWHFPNPNRDSLSILKNSKTLQRYYAKRFKDAAEVTRYVADNFDRLTSTTRLWRDTWYDSTLPYWFLDRTFATVSTAATATCYRFDDGREGGEGGRFYGNEGTYCCPGTCTHVWQYGHSIARVFPALERSVRRLIDFDQEFNAQTGLIHYRGEAGRELAIDGQCGTILRAYREHTTAADDSFLKQVWPNVKRAIQLVIARDENQDGILDGPQYNTLDTTWFLSSTLGS